jgi:protein SCO1/2
MTLKFLPHIFGILLPLLLVGCYKPTPASTPPLSTNATERVFDTRGVVRALPEGGRTLVVRHEEIPGYMPRMTMELNVRNTNELHALDRDDEISFRLVATADTHWIENIKRVGRVAPDDAPAAIIQTNAHLSELGPGDLLPDYELLSEDGRKIRFSDFRGHAVAFTFIFTRCPLPDYCPRMGNNFATARELVRQTPNAPTNWQFLAISFDPEFDTPARLRNYGNLYRANNPDRWLFAVASSGVLSDLAPRVDLLIARESGGSISHNLRTVVLDPHGRVHRQFDGNQWSPEALAESLIEAARTSKVAVPTPD